MMPGLSPALLKQLEAAGFYVFRESKVEEGAPPLKRRASSSDDGRPASSSAGRAARIKPS